MKRMIDETEKIKESHLSSEGINTTSTFRGLRTNNMVI